MFITEETEVEFKEYSQLGYIDNFDTTPSGSPLVALYVDKKFIGDIEVWCDAENDERDYICVNYEMIYLDTIREMF